MYEMVLRSLKSILRFQNAVAYVPDRPRGVSASQDTLGLPEPCSLSQRALPHSAFSSCLSFTKASCGPVHVDALGTHLFFHSPRHTSGVFLFAGPSSYPTVQSACHSLRWFWARGDSCGCDGPLSLQDEQSAVSMLKKHQILEQAVEDYAETVHQLSKTSRALVADSHPER